MHMSTETTSTVTDLELKLETLEEITIIVDSILSTNPPSIEAMNTQLRRIAEHGELVFGVVVDLVCERIGRRIGSPDHPSLRNNQAYLSLVRFRNK